MGVTYFSAKVVGGLRFNNFDASNVTALAVSMATFELCSMSSSMPGLPAEVGLPFLEAKCLGNPADANGESKLIGLSLSLLDGIYEIEDCRRPFLTLVIPTGDSGNTGESAPKLCKTG